MTTDRGRLRRWPAPPPRAPVFRLMFILPRELGTVAPGRHQPTEGGPTIEVDLAGLVHVTGRSRGEVFNHAATFLRLQSKNRPPATLIATLIWPPGTHDRDRQYTDHWSLAVGADVSWAPTPLGAEIARA